MVYTFPFGKVEATKQAEKDLKALLKRKKIPFIRLFIQSYSMILIEVKELDTAIQLVKAIRPHRLSISVEVNRESITLTTLESGYKGFEITL